MIGSLSASCLFFSSPCSLNLSNKLPPFLFSFPVKSNNPLVPDSFLGFSFSSSGSFSPASSSIISRKPPPSPSYPDLPFNAISPFFIYSPSYLANSFLTLSNLFFALNLSIGVLASLYSTWALFTLPLFISRSVLPLCSSGIVLNSLANSFNLIWNPVSSGKSIPCSLASALISSALTLSVFALPPLDSPALAPALAPITIAANNVNCMAHSTSVVLSASSSKPVSPFSIIAVQESSSKENTLVIALPHVLLLPHRFLLAASFCSRGSVTNFRLSSFFPHAANASASV